MSLVEAYGRIRNAMNLALQDTARYVPVDVKNKVNLRIDIDGQEQRKNSKGWAEHKKRTRGHDIPLKWGPKGKGTEIFSNPSKYLVNGRNAQGQIPLSENLSYVVKMPEERAKIILEYLVLAGYRPPWGVSRETREFFRRAVRVQLEIAKRANVPL